MGNDGTRLAGQRAFDPTLLSEMLALSLTLGSLSASARDLHRDSLANEMKMPCLLFIHSMIFEERSDLSFHKTVFWSLLKVELANVFVVHESVRVGVQTSEG